MAGAGRSNGPRLPLLTGGRVVLLGVGARERHPHKPSAPIRLSPTPRSKPAPSIKTMHINAFKAVDHRRFQTGVLRCDQRRRQRPLLRFVLSHHFLLHCRQKSIRIEEPGQPEGNGRPPSSHLIHIVPVEQGVTTGPRSEESGRTRLSTAYVHRCGTAKHPVVGRESQKRMN